MFRMLKYRLCNKEHCDFVKYLDTADVAFFTEKGGGWKKNCAQFCPLPTSAHQQAKVSFF